MTLDPRAALFRSLGLFPLQPDDPAYVPCESVRGDMDVLRELGDTIVLSGEEEGYTCQLYTGARGSGKSTELLRLKQYLKAQGYFVVYFEADKGDIEIDDTEHTDILLACTRHIIEDLKELADAQPLFRWLKERLDSLVELGLTEVELEKVGVEFQLPQFVKLMTNFKSLPDLRADVRKKIDLYTPSLVEILNEFINQAKSKLPEQYFQGEIVVIVDNLDRMVLQTDGKHSNYERIFIDRRNLMQGLHCHLIYTVPISMKYAPYSPTLAEDYDQLVMLPMIMIRNRQGEPHQAGIEILKEMVRRRLERSQVLIELENLFESPDDLEILCQKSGGYVRNLVQLMQSAVRQVQSIPISNRAVNLVISELQAVYHDSIYAEDWQRLAEVSLCKRISQDSNDGEYRDLLFRRCILEYSFTTETGKKEKWQDVHPLIEAMDEFIEARENRRKAWEAENGSNSSN